MIAGIWPFKQADTSNRNGNFIEKDPNEQKNLWARPEYKEKKEELIRVLLNWRMRGDNNTADWTKPLR